MSLFQSNVRKQIRNLPKILKHRREKILNFVKKIHYFSKLFTSLLTCTPAPRILVSSEDLPLQHIKVLAGCPQAVGVPREALIDLEQNLKERAELHLVEVLRAVRVPNLTLRLLVFFVTVCRFFSNTSIPLRNFAVPAFPTCPSPHAGASRKGCGQGGGSVVS